MYFYKVWVRSNRYRGQEALTYSSAENIAPGALVRVPLQQQEVLGVVVTTSERPSFATKPLVLLPDLPPLPEVLLKTINWLQHFYATPLGVATQLIVPTAITKPRRPVGPSTTPVEAVSLPPLTAEQKAALQTIASPGTYLLHGKTGTGKTRIYIELAKQAIANQKSALILSPEIGLTSQLARNFTEVFGSHVVVLHSQLTVAERQAAWLTILRSTEPLVVIGPRSALFSPIRTLGVIVVDESHEPAYKQEQAPYYHTSRVAAQLAQEHKTSLVLGSATPPLVDYFMAEQRGRPIIRLSTLAKSSVTQPVQHTVVDLKNRTEFSRSSYLSNTLLEAIEGSLKRGEQTLLYLNRRGTARLTVCDHCGWQAVCPHCNLPLAYHHDLHRLQCHVCGYYTSPPSVCPACAHPSITFRAIGTKAIVDEVQRIFPTARVQRFDTDNKKADRLAAHYDAVYSGKVDILVGTQMLAKGLDLPRLSTIGVVAADSSLALPDYTAGERTYQLLRQVLGRLGRGHREGRAIIQTYTPDHPLIKAAINDEWEYFYRTELAERRKYNFPPYCHLLKLTCRRASAASAEKAAKQLKTQLESAIPSLAIEGPAPAFHEKLQGKYQWQLVVKAQRRSDLLQALTMLPKSGWSYDIDPLNLL